MSNITKAIAALGVVASLGVTALPLSTYAATKTAESNSIPVTAEINNAIAVTTSKTAIDLGTVMPGGPISTDTIDVIVTTAAMAKGYNLYVVDSDADNALHKDGVLSDATNAIPAGAAGKGTTAWGYRIAGSGADFKGVPVYTDTPSQILTTGTTATDPEYNEEGQDDAEKYPNAPYDGTTTVEFGVSVKGDFAGDNGTYEGAVVFIATAEA